MGNLSENMTKTFSDLRKDKEKRYSGRLIQNLQNGYYEVLEEILESNQRGDIAFMEPILYAVKNEHGTYKVYKYYGENLQNNIELARDIIKEEPELLKDTPISNNPQYVLELSTINPKIVKYMSPTLKSNNDFVEQLCESENKEVIQQVVKECKMPDVVKENLLLAGNIKFMKEAVKEDASFLKYADNNLKNNYEFLKEISINNKEVIGYVSENTEDFGKEALTATKESLVDMSSEEAISGFREEEERISKELDSKDDTEKEKLARRQKQLQRHIKLFERIRSGEIDPVRAAKFINKRCSNLDEEYKKEIEQLLKIDKAILDKQKENQEKADTVEHKGYTNRDIEKVTTDKIILKEYNEETKLTAKGVQSTEEFQKTSGTPETPVY